MRAYLYFCAVLLGLCVGSFLNVVVHRLPRGTFFANARSVCPACGRRLPWYDLVPVISFLALRGKCRACQAGISPRYPIVELAGALLAAGALWNFGFDWRAPLAFAVCAVLLAVALIDAATMEIPDALVIALTPLAAAAVWAWRGEISLLERGIGLLAVSLPMFLLTLAIPGAFGGGDVKLMAVCGFLLGWQGALAAMFIAVLTGGSLAAYLMLTGKAKRGARIPFGPHLCLGVAASLFWGRALIEMYLGWFGFL